MENITLITIAATIVSGVTALALSHKTGVPSILFFLVFGVALGPELANVIRPSVFQDNFPHYISLMVALILFEGGSSLKISQFREISRLLRRLLTVGIVVTLAGVSLAAHFLASLAWRESVILGSVLIVTGPTVVIPLLQRLRVRATVHNALKWEAILIDPIGVVTAIVIFEFFARSEVAFARSAAEFLWRFGVGVSLGLAGGWIAEQLLTRRRLFRFDGEELGSLLVIALVFLCYGLSETLASHSGLVVATVIGIYLGNRSFAYQEHVFRFERQLTLFALAVLFVLLSAQIPLGELRRVARPGLILLAVMIFLVRPAAVFASAGTTSGLDLRSRLFLSLFAPRGIVSASLATVFGLGMARDGAAGGEAFLALCFFLIVGSIVFYASTGPITARLLNVREGAPTGILMVGVTPLSLAFAAELRRRGRSVQFIDTNPARCEEARVEMFDATEGSGFDLGFLESLDYKGVERMVAMTPSHEVNLLACQAFSRLLGADRVYRQWDPTDNWEAVVAPGYDQSLGRPILATYPTIPAGELTMGTVPVASAFRVTRESLAAGGLERPLFAWTSAGLVFITPDAAVPAGAEVACLRSSERSAAPKIDSLARRVFEGVRKLYES